MNRLPTQPNAPQRPTRARVWRWAGVGVLALALLGVFSMYTQPDFVFTVANQVWACF